MDDEYVTLYHDGVQAETDYAVLFAVADADYWISKSLIRSWDVHAADIKLWILEKKGLV